MTNKVEYKNQMQSDEPDPGWKDLLRIGVFVSLLAGVVFRRNIAAEISLISGTLPPTSALDWFTLLQENRILGVISLDAFDIFNHILVGLMFLVIYIPLKRTNKSRILVATVLGIVGATLYIASNVAFSMLSLSDQFVIATTEVERSALVASGEAILSISQGTGFYASLILEAIASLMVSVVMLQGCMFSRITAYIGILAGVCDLSYVIALQFSSLLGILLISAAGLFLTIWHILVGRRLYLLSKEVDL
jgi:hypothetical protein